MLLAPPVCSADSERLPAPMPDSPTPPTDPDGQAVYHVLAKDGQPTGEEVYNAVQGTRNMAGQTIAALIEAWRTESNARFEALNARFADLHRQIATLRWMMGLGFTALGLLVALLKLLD